MKKKIEKKKKDKLKKVKTKTPNALGGILVKKGGKNAKSKTA